MNNPEQPNHEPPERRCFDKAPEMYAGLGMGGAALVLSEYVIDWPVSPDIINGIAGAALVISVLGVGVSAFRN